MTRYIWGANSRSTFDFLIEMGCKNILVSYAYAGYVNRDPMEMKEMMGDGGWLFIDSGAFTAAQSGYPINEGDYIDYLKQWKAHLDEYVVLDHILEPEDIAQGVILKQSTGGMKGRVGLKAMKRISGRKVNRRLEALNKEAVERFHAAGLDPIGVWHGRGESVDQLKWLAQNCSKIGCGISGGLDDAFTLQTVANQYNRPTHGFAFTRLSRFDLVKRFDSVDSVSWSEAARFTGFSPHGRFKGSGDFGGSLYQMSGFSRWQKDGHKIASSQIKDYDTGIDTAAGKRQATNRLRMEISVQEIQRRLRTLGIQY